MMAKKRKRDIKLISLMATLLCESNVISAITTEKTVQSWLSDFDIEARERPEGHGRCADKECLWPHHGLLIALSCAVPKGIPSSYLHRLVELIAESPVVQHNG